MPRVSEIGIYEQRECPTLVVRTRSSVQNLMNVTMDVYGRINAYLAELKETPAGIPFITYHNMDMNDLDIAVGIPVAKELPPRGDMASGRLPQARVVTCMHRGPYNSTGPTYEEMHKWIAAKGLTLFGVVREAYFNSPDDVSEDELLTEITMPLK
ncbi:MAG: GyrI-like domain-containing protein [Methanomassiliicoccaceae archaeon]|nr:GyrI-like domain-containing protein [Methanomassiliicoccaceae archaeon]